MRWLFLLLLCANGLVYLIHLNEQDAVAVRAQAPSALDPKAGIRLLSEAKPAVRPERTAGKGAGCTFIGGFDEESTALAVEQRLLSLDIDSRVEPMDEAAGVDYWVYLPPLVSRQASLRQLRELQSRNVDSYIITVGDLTNGVSLGIFSRRDSAESVVERLQAIDYSASIRELPRSHRRYWVRIPRADAAFLTDAIVAELAESFPALERQQLPCSGVATSR